MLAGCGSDPTPTSSATSAAASSDVQSGDADSSAASPTTVDPTAGIDMATLKAIPTTYPNAVGEYTLKDDPYAPFPKDGKPDATLMSDFVKLTPVEFSASGSLEIWKNEAASVLRNPHDGALQDNVACKLFYLSSGDKLQCLILMSNGTIQITDLPSGAADGYAAAIKWAMDFYALL